MFLETGVSMDIQGALCGWSVPPQTMRLVWLPPTSRLVWAPQADILLQSELTVVQKMCWLLPYSLLLFIHQQLMCTAHRRAISALKVGGVFSDAVTHSGGLICSRRSLMRMVSIPVMCVKQTCCGSASCTFCRLIWTMSDASGTPTAYDPVPMPGVLLVCLNLCITFLHIQQLTACRECQQHCPQKCKFAWSQKRPVRMTLLGNIYITDVLSTTGMHLKCCWGYVTVLEAVALCTALNIDCIIDSHHTLELLCVLIWTDYDTLVTLPWNSVS